MKLYEAGTSACAFKDVIFKMLPEEVLDFSKENLRKMNVIKNVDRALPVNYDYRI